MAFHNVPPNGFPDLPDVEELEAVIKDVTNLKTSVAGLSEDVSDLNDNKANQITIAPFFNSETAYEAGDLVYYNGLSYRCTNAHEGEWDADDFAATTIAGELAEVKSGLTNLHYHKVAESASTGTIADKLTTLESAYASIGLDARKTCILVKNNNDLFFPVNCLGDFSAIFVDATSLLFMSAHLSAHTYIYNNNGTTTDASSDQNNYVYSLWIVE